MPTDRPAIRPGGTIDMPDTAHPRTRLARVAAQQLAGELRNDEVGGDVAAQVLDALTQHPALLRALADEVDPPRVWWPDGPDPATGTWVLVASGYVDRIVDRDDPGAVAVGCPVVEVRLPDYRAAVDRAVADQPRRPACRTCGGPLCSHGLAWEHLHPADDDVIPHPPEASCSVCGELVGVDAAGAYEHAVPYPRGHHAATPVLAGAQGGGHR